MSTLDLHQVADDLDHAINGIEGELQHLELPAAPCEIVVSRCREHLDVLRRITGEIVEDLHLH